MQNTIHLAAGSFWTPADNERRVRYSVERSKSINHYLPSNHPMEIVAFDEIEEAIAFVGNCEAYYGPDMNVYEEDLASGNRECVLAGEWHEDVLGGRYLN